MAANLTRNCRAGKIGTSDLQKCSFPARQHHRCQETAIDRAGIDIDPSPLVLEFLRRRVAVYDNIFMFNTWHYERSADPHQILRVLIREGAARIHKGVTALQMGITQRVQKRDVGRSGY